VQWQLSPTDYVSVDRLRRRVEHVTRRAAGEAVRRKEPVLVAFPEAIGMPFLLVGQPARVFRAHDLEEAVSALIRRAPLGVFARRVRYRVSWQRAVLLSRAAVAQRAYEEVFSSVAKRFGAYIAAGSTVLPVGGRPEVHNVGYLFGPDGEVALRQAKVHLIEMEGPEGLDLSPGSLDDVGVVDTPFGKVGIAVCLDGFEEDVLQRLEAAGCEILVQPSANPEPWSLEQREDWQRGAAASVRRTAGPKLTLNPMMVGKLFDVAFEGQSGIFARDRTAFRPVLAGTRPEEAGYLGLPPDPHCIAVAPPNREYVIAVQPKEG